MIDEIQKTDSSANHICQNCGRPIEQSVLRKNPYAGYCASCSRNIFDGPDLFDADDLEY